jgi:hypothetical protein
MKSLMQSIDHRRMLAFSLAAILALSAATANLSFTNSKTSAPVFTQTLPDEIAEVNVGAGPGTCGIAVGIAAGVIGLGLAGVTVGFGAAVAISIGFHATALLCVGSNA